MCIYLFCIFSELLLYIKLYINNKFGIFLKLFKLEYIFCNNFFNIEFGFLYFIKLVKFFLKGIIFVRVFNLCIFIFKIGNSWVKCVNLRLYLYGISLYFIFFEINLYICFFFVNSDVMV